MLLLFGGVPWYGYTGLFYIHQVKDMGFFHFSGDCE